MDWRLDLKYKIKRKAPADLQLHKRSIVFLVPEHVQDKR